MSSSNIQFIYQNQIFEVKDAFDISRVFKIADEFEVDYIIKGNGDEYNKLSKEVQDKIKAYRMATMGRLAEIGVVDWKIRKGNSGNAESFYLINTK